MIARPFLSILGCLAAVWATTGRAQAPGSPGLAIPPTPASARVAIRRHALNGAPPPATELAALCHRYVTSTATLTQLLPGIPKQAAHDLLEQGQVALHWGRPFAETVIIEHHTAVSPRTTECSLLRLLSREQYNEAVRFIGGLSLRLEGNRGSYLCLRGSGRDEDVTGYLQLHVGSPYSTAPRSLFFEIKGPDRNPGRSKGNPVYSGRPCG